MTDIDVVKIAIRIGACNNLKEVQIAFLEECILQLEQQHAELSLRTYDPTDIDIALLRVKETQKEIEDQIEAANTVLQSIQGGPHGKASNPGRRLDPRDRPASTERSGASWDADADGTNSPGGR